MIERCRAREAIFAVGKFTGAFCHLIVHQLARSHPFHLSCTGTRRADADVARLAHHLGTIPCGRGLDTRRDALRIIPRSRLCVELVVRRPFAGGTSCIIFLQLGLYRLSVIVRLEYSCSTKFPYRYPERSPST